MLRRSVGQVKRVFQIISQAVATFLFKPTGQKRDAAASGDKTAFGTTRVHE